MFRYSLGSDVLFVKVLHGNGVTGHQCQWLADCLRGKMNSQGQTALLIYSPEEDGSGAVDSSSEPYDRSDAHAAAGQTNVLTGTPGAPSMEESHRKCPTMIREICVVEQKTPNRCKQASLMLASLIFCPANVKSSWQLYPKAPMLNFVFVLAEALRYFQSATILSTER